VRASQDPLAVAAEGPDVRALRADPMHALRAE